MGHKVCMLMGPVSDTPPAGEPREWFKILAKADSDDAEVMIYDNVGGGWMGGITARDFCAQLAAVKAKRIAVRINSDGGEITEGIAIYEALKRHGAEITTHVDGIAASIASVIALAGSKVCIAKNAFIMIHNGLVEWAGGDARDLRKTADMLEKMSKQIAAIYAEKSGKSVEECQAAMDEETWFNAGEAKAFGLVDEIGEGDEDDDELSAAALRATLKYKKAPLNLRKIAAKATTLPPLTKEPTVAKMYSRDGKNFIKVDDKEIEVEQAPAAAPAAAVNPTAAGNPAPTAKVLTPDEAVAQEREYRKAFNTAVKAAGITGKEAEDFETTFYGKDLGMVKQVCSYRIAGRAQPAGEGSGDSAPAQGADPAGAEGKAAAAAGDKKIEEEATARWHTDARLRRMHNVTTSNREDGGYKACLARYIQAEMKCAADQKNGTGRAVMSDKGGGDDKVSKTLAKENVTMQWKENKA